jgi:hypothetical protein
MSSLSLREVYEGFQKYPFAVQDFSYPMVGRNQEWTILVDRVEQSLRKAGNEIVVIRGDYGMGKSFTLAKLYDKFSSRNEYFVPKPISLLSSEQASRFAVDLANRLFERIGFDQMRELTRNAKESWRGKISPRASEIFSGLLSDDTKEAETAFNNSFLSPKLQIRDAQWLIFGLQFILASNRKRALLWLIDEFEYILVLSKPKLSQLTQTLRELYDRQTDFENEFGPNASAKIIFVFATSPSGWERLALTAEGASMRAGLTGAAAGVGVAPFHRRVSPTHIVDIEPLSRVDTRKLIEARMKRRDRDVRPSYIPFTEDFITYIYEMSKGRPNEIVMLCDVIFLEAHAQKLKEVDQKRAKEILLKLRLRAEPE